MKLYISLYLLIILNLSVSCKEKSIDDISNKKEYVELVCDLSENARKTRLLEDAAYLTGLLDSIKDVRLYYSMSFGGGGISSNKDIKEVAAFSLPLADNVVSDFSLIKDLNAEQKFELPNSDFKFHPGSIPDIINENDIKYELKKVFIKNTAIEPNNLKLQRADSLLVTANYTFATAFDTIIIHPEMKDKILYNNYSLDVDEADDNKIELEYPLDLQVIGYQAISKDNKLMNNKSLSSFPIYGLNPEVIGRIEKTVAILKAASDINDQEALKHELEKIEDVDFEIIKGLKGAKIGYEQIKENNEDQEILEMIRQLKAYMRKYADIFVPIKQHLELGFPQPYNKLLIYVSSNTRTISRDFIATCESEDDNWGYNVYLDNTSGKYGIIDSKSNIVIPAAYSYLIQKNDSFFQENINNDTIITYYLIPEEKKFEKLPDNIYFVDYLNDNLTLFSNKDSYQGVLDKNRKEVIPYQYDNISLFDNLIMCAKSKRGRYTYEFYKTDGTKIDLPVIVDARANKKGNFLLKGKNKKKGVLNQDGILSVPIEYDYLNFLNDNDLFVYQNIESDNKSENNLFGIINTSGKIISQPVIKYINSFSEGLAAVYFPTKSDWEDIAGYIDENGQIVIKPIYSEAGNFYKGYALVQKDNKYFLIDKKGIRIINFPTDSSIWFIESDSEDQDIDNYYESGDGKKYNYKGDPIR